MDFHPRQQRRILVLGAIIVAIGLALASEVLHGRMAAFVLWAEAGIERAPATGVAVFVLLAMASAMLAFFSSAFLTPIAVATWGTWGCMLLLWLGWLLGGIASYAVGRLFGRRVAAALVGDETIERWSSQLGERARFRHVLLFQAVVPSEIPGYVLGTLGYSFALYAIALAVTELPYVIAAVLLGESFLQGRSGVFLAVGAGVLLFAVALHLARRRRAGRDMDAGGPL